ncbi:MAG: hypothetical protein AMJ81_01980, partial [Phycisphaerae bacterium SM23_33]
MTQTAADSAQMALLERLEPRLLLSGSTPLSELFGHALAAEPNPFGDIEISSQPPTPGDANLDRYVDGLDYNIWSDHYLHTGVGWDSGEFTGDDLVDGLDYNIWSQHYGTQPEPDPPPDDPVPGSDVTWYTEDLGDGLRLMVLGTDGDDAIT